MILSKIIDFGALENKQTKQSEQSFDQNFWKKILTLIIFDLEPQLNVIWKFDSAESNGFFMIL